MPWVFLIGITLNLWFATSCIVILVVLILLAHEASISFHLFMASSISLVNCSILTQWKTIQQ